jgi:hypothetical protein
MLSFLKKENENEKKKIKIYSITFMVLIRTDKKKNIKKIKGRIKS